MTGHPLWSSGWRADVLAWWQAGQSASEVAERLLAVHAVQRTRNAVIGIIHRARLAGHELRTVAVKPPPVRKPKPPRPARADTREVSPDPAQSAATSERPAVLPGGVVVVQAGKSLADLGPRDCRWIEGDPREARPFCGQPRHGRGPYCKAHRARAWQRPTESTPRHRRAEGAAKPEEKPNVF